MAKQSTKSNGANIGFEETLWSAADKMRNNMDPAEYKHVVLGLIFLKYISDSFEEVFNEIKSDKDYYAGQEDKDAYLAEGVFWVPQVARWEYLKANAKKPEIGKMLDDAMIAIEKDNPSLKGVLAKNYARPDLDKVRLGELIDLMSSIGLGDRASRSKDVLGRVYEYFLGRFAGAEGKGGGEFFTPQSVVKLLVEMIEPFKGRVYDPCCGSGGMFVQSEKFVEAHGGQTHDLAIYGQESNPTTWRLCKMNLAIRGIEGNLGPNNADTFHNDLHKDLKADFILANPPFNISDWSGERLKDDVRWKYGTPPANGANYAWIQHMIHHLSPTGIAGFVMSNGSLSSNQSGEGQIRENLIKNGLVDCIVSLPDKLFYTTPISACLWFVSRDRYNHKFRDRHDQILFIDARKMGKLVDKRHRELSDDDINFIANTYHSWRNKDGKYKDVSGFSKSCSLEEVDLNHNILNPGQFVGLEHLEEEFISFEERINTIAKKINTHYEEAVDLEKLIQKEFSKLEYHVFEKTKFSVAENQTLENLAKTLFNHWFVDFEFPNTSNKPFKSSGGKLIDSPLGKIPNGWTVATLEDIADKAKNSIVDGPFGTQMKISEYQDSGVPIVELEYLEGYPLYKKFKHYISEEKYEDVKRSSVHEGDIVISKTGTLGMLGIMTNIWDKAVLVSRLAKITPDKEKINTYFLFTKLKILSEHKYWEGIASGSTMPLLNLNHLKRTKILLPPIDLQNQYGKIVEMFYRLIFNNLIEK